MTSGKFSWIACLLMPPRPAVLVAMKNLSTESCRYGNLFSRILYPFLWVCLFSTVWVTSSLHTSSLGVFRAGAVQQCFHHGSRRINQDCLCWGFLCTWTQKKIIQKPDFILGSEGSRQCCRMSFHLLNANEHRINILCSVHGSLVAEIKYARTREIAW